MSESANAHINTNTRPASSTSSGVRTPNGLGPFGVSKSEGSGRPDMTRSMTARADRQYNSPEYRKEWF